MMTFMPSSSPYQLPYGNLILPLVVTGAALSTIWTSLERALGNPSLGLSKALAFVIGCSIGSGLAWGVTYVAQLIADFPLEGSDSVYFLLPLALGMVLGGQVISISFYRLSNLKHRLAPFSWLATALAVVAIASIPSSAAISLGVAPIEVPLGYMMDMFIQALFVLGVVWTVLFALNLLIAFIIRAF